jgi:DNA-binding MarR family transcriptional regulator
MKIMPSALEAAHLIDRLDRLARSGAVVDGLNAAQWEALRYLARANRFSRTPAALADYLGSTRGTVSQTLIALEQKGFVERVQNARDKRSVDVALTAHGTITLAQDPLLDLARHVSDACGSGLEVFTSMLRDTLHRAVAQNGGRAFGACHTCQHFQHASGKVRAMPYHCGLLNEPLSSADSRLICIEQAT